MTLDLPPISRSAPHRGAHTAKSNLVRPLGYPPGRRRPGGHAAGSGDASTHPPALPCAGRVRGVTNPLRRGRGLLPSYRRLLQGRPLPQRQSDALGIQGGVECLPHPPLTHRRRHGWLSGGVGCLPHPPLTHRRRHGWLSGVWGAGCGVGCRGRGPLCGPPGKPQGAQGPRAATRAAPPLGPGPSTLDKLPPVW